MNNKRGKRPAKMSRNEWWSIPRGVRKYINSYDIQARYGDHEVGGTWYFTKNLAVPEACWWFWTPRNR